MKECNACRICVANPHQAFCPLCGEELTEGAAPACALPRNPYPDLAGRLVQYNFIMRLLLFLTLLGCGISVLVNLLAAPGFLWCLIVIAAAGYCWLIIPPLLRRGVNYATRVVWQVLFTSALVVALDFIIGYQGWSVTFVIPSLLNAGILALALLAAINRTNWVQYVFAQVLVGVFSFVPLVLYLFGISQNLVMVLVTSCLGLASILITLVFGDRTIKSEFKRRFHM